MSCWLTFIKCNLNDTEFENLFLECHHKLRVENANKTKPGQQNFYLNGQTTPQSSMLKR